MVEFNDNPEFNDLKIGDKYAIELPVFVWTQIGQYLQFLDDSTDAVYPAGIVMLIRAINEMTFPAAFRQAQKAAYHQHKQQHMEDHPLLQFLKGVPGVQIETIPNPEDFTDPDNS